MMNVPDIFQRRLARFRSLMILLALSAGAAAFGRQGQAAVTPSGATPEPGSTGGKAIPVYVGRVERTRISETLTLRGKLVSPDRVDLFSTFGGDVIALTVDVGDRVRKGDLLVKVKRIEPGFRFEPVEVTAPLSGRVVQRNISVGSRVTPQTPLLAVAADDTLLFRADLLEMDAAKVRVGMKGVVRLADGTRVQGTLLRIGPTAEPGKRVLPADFLLPDPDHRLVPGTTGGIDLRLASRESLTIPRDALIRKRRVDGVFKVVSGSAAWVPVTLEGEWSDRLEVAGENLAPGDSVVTFGHEALSDGAPVEVREDLRR